MSKICPYSQMTPSPHYVPMHPVPPRLRRSIYCRHKSMPRNDRRAMSPISSGVKVRMYLLESAQRSIHRFFDECTTDADDEVRLQLTQIALQIAQVRRKLVGVKNEE